jgi:hypothetical protein
MTSKHTMSGVKVKPLEWEYPTDATNGCHVARCAFGTYSAVNEQGWYVTLDEHPYGQGFEWSAPDMRMTFEDAKAAAQADYNARILSAIAPSEAEPDEGEAAIDALRHKAFMTNSEADRQAYFDAVSKWFQHRNYRRMAHPDSSREAVRGALESIIERSNNGELGTSKVADMRRLALAALNAINGGVKK